MVGARRSAAAFDVHCPLGSLPLACKTELVERAGRRFPICAPSEERIAKWRPRLDGAAGPRVALAWSGSADPHQRPQPFDRAGAARAAAGDAGRELRQHPARCCARPTAKRLRRCRASRMSATSLRISPTPPRCWRSPISSICGRHLGRASRRRDGAAALGAAAVPAGLALDARSRTSPWYPDARLFRQPSPGDWSSVLKRLSEELASEGAAVT